jgi:hypothetical protein
MPDGIDEQDDQVQREENADGQQQRLENLAHIEALDFCCQAIIGGRRAGLAGEDIMSGVGLTWVFEFALNKRPGAGIIPGLIQVDRVLNRAIFPETS